MALLLQGQRKRGCIETILPEFLHFNLSSNFKKKKKKRKQRNISNANNYKSNLLLQIFVITSLWNELILFTLYDVELSLIRHLHYFN